MFTLVGNTANVAEPHVSTWILETPTKEEACDSQFAAVVRVKELGALQRHVIVSG